MYMMMYLVFASCWTIVDDVGAVVAPLAALFCCPRRFVRIVVFDRPMYVVLVRDRLPSSSLPPLHHVLLLCF